MKKTLAWSIAIITSIVSLVAMCIFDFVLSVIYYFIGKVPFLSEIIDFIGEILDLGLTVFVAYVIAISIWAVGHSIIKRIKGKAIAYRDSPLSFINNLFIFPVLVVALFWGYNFVMLIGEVVGTYTSGFQGIDKVLLFFKAIKDTISFVFNENIILYRISLNALCLFFINTYSDNFID